MVAVFINPSQSATSQWGWGFHTILGGIYSGDHRFRPRFVGASDVWKDSHSEDDILPRWLHESQPISDQPVVLGFSHRAGWYRLGITVSVPDLLGLYMHEKNDDAGMDPYLFRLALVL